jgi:hypothetical protein
MKRVVVTCTYNPLTPALMEMVRLACGQEYEWMHVPKNMDLDDVSELIQYLHDADSILWLSGPDLLLAKLAATVADMERSRRYGEYPILNLVYSVAGELFIARV